MVKNTRHIVLSIGTRHDFPPHEYLWCERCGAQQQMRFPLQIREAERIMKSFKRAHIKCAEISDDLLSLGFVKRLDGNYVWGGFLSIEVIAQNAFDAAVNRNGLCDLFIVPPYKSELAEKAVRAIICDRKSWKDIEWFSKNYGKVLGYENQDYHKHSTVYPGMRMKIFMKVACALLERKK